MKKDEALNRLKVLYSEIEELRKKFGISAKGEEIFAGDLSKSRILVVANGLGAADLMIVDGNYPVDFYTRNERSFNTEEEAFRQAARLLANYTEEEAFRQAARLLANYNNVSEEEEDEGKDWNDLIEEIFDK